MSLDYQITEMPLIPILGKTMKFVDALINKAFQDNKLNVTKNQFILLKYVHDKPMPQTSLTLITDCNKSSLTRLVHSMEKKGLVNRMISAKDKRINMVKITAKGRKVYEIGKPIIDTIFNGMLYGISEKEQKGVKDIFEKIMKNTKNELEKLSITV